MLRNLGLYHTNMKLIAIPTRDGMVDDHFGHCAYYTVFTLDEQNQVIYQERLDSPEGCGCKSNIASVMQEMGITLMLAGNMDLLDGYESEEELRALVTRLFSCPSTSPPSFKMLARTLTSFWHGTDHIAVIILSMSCSSGLQTS